MRNPLLNDLFHPSNFLAEKKEDGHRVLVHSEVGKIVFRKTRRNRSIRVVVRPHKEVLVTLPYYVSYADADKFVCEHIAWVQAQQTSQNAKHSPQKEYTAEEITHLRQQAKLLLPARIEELAQQYHFVYAGVSFKNMHSRWGSCSPNNRLNLSIYLMNLTDELINYVILHELCHTVHKNHGEKFWRLLDTVTNGQAKDLARQMRKLQNCI
ncbi:hypothetical protein AGMMS4956_19130 [Bacteroidia bacterium]|nr:hypothetical protein AGMMS4956_19130 [Bacteroidia bacterium]